MKNCEYFLVHYVSALLEEVRVAIGLLLFESPGRLVRYGLTRDWRTVRCLDPGADRALLETLPAYFDQLVAESSAEDAEEGNPAGEALRRQLLRMEENYSGTLQISPPRGVETADPEREFDRLFEEHVGRRRPVFPRPGPREGSRRWVQARVQEALERHQLTDRLRQNIPVEEFTAPGDGFRIDFAYRPNGVIKYLHALSLERDWNQAKVLSYTFWRIRERTPATLTAIVAEANPTLPSAQSCRQILLESQIALQPLSGLDVFLEEVRRELQHP